MTTFNSKSLLQQSAALYRQLLGTSQQRSDALRLGLQGDDRACDRITNIG